MCPGDNIINLLKYLMIGLFLYCTYTNCISHKKCNKIENFNNKRSEVLHQSYPNIHKLLTSKCDKRFCNATNWNPFGSNNKFKLKDDEVLSNFTTNGKCCVIKKDLMNYLISRGKNA